MLTDVKFFAKFQAEQSIASYKIQITKAMLPITDPLLKKHASSSKIHTLTQPYPATLIMSKTIFK